MGRGRGFLIRVEGLVLVSVVLAGCFGSTSGEVPPEIRHGDTASYSAVLWNSTGIAFPLNLTIDVGQRATRVLPDGGQVEVLPIVFTFHNDTYSFTRQVDWGLGAARVVALGDLSRSHEGADQFAARTRQWHGHPEGHMTPERCVITILEAAIGRVRGETLVPFGPSATWDAASGRIRSEDGRDLGTLMISGSGWPEEAEWDQPMGRCAVDLASIEGGGPRIEWRGEDRRPAPLARVPMDGRAPRTGVLPIAIQLGDAVRAVEADPRAQPYFQENPAAWLVEAEYHGPAATGQGEHPDEWVLQFSEGGVEARGFYKVTQPLPGVLLVESLLPLRPRPALSSSILAGGVVEADAAGDRFWGNIPPSQVDAIGWYTATDPVDAALDDAGVWQFRWSEADGWHNLVASGITGAPLALVKARERPIP